MIKTPKDGVAEDETVSFCNDLVNQIMFGLDPKFKRINYPAVSSIGFTIDNILTIYFNVSGSGAYRITCSIELGKFRTSVGDVNLASGTGKNYGYKCGVKAALGEKSFSLILRGYNCYTVQNGQEIEGPNFHLSVFYSKISDNEYILGFNGMTTTSAPTTRKFAISNELLYSIDGNMVYSVPTRLPYLSDNPLKIDGVENKLIVKNGMKYTTFGDLTDCSTLTGDQFYPIGSKVYYAVNENTLMEV